MPLIAKEGLRQDPIPDGTHHAVCYSIVDLGTQPPLPHSKYPKKEHKVRITWELPEERREFDTNDGVHVNKPQVIGQEYTLSLNEKAKLRRTLESWRARKFSAEELAGFDLAKVLGANCLLTTFTDERGYSQIGAVSALTKLIPKREPENAPVYFALDDHPLGMPLPDTLPEWLRNKIMQSDEWKARDSSGYGRDDGEPPPHDDDIPF